MADNSLFKPKSYALRGATDPKKEHGRIVNPPRMAKMGGMDQANEPNGHFRNSMSLRKPGGTK